MAQKIQVSLEFSADTGKAKKQIQELQSSLTKAIDASARNKDLGLSPKLEQARLDAMKLKIALENAVNVNTGKLNLNKFSKEMNAAGLNAQKLATQMKSLGPEGAQAFQQIAQAVASAETKMFSLSAGMQRLANTFMNTVRYQASAKAIDMMTSSITDAISFTKQLNKSLTDIALVNEKWTGPEDMARFAKQANRAAKELSTTTNEFAKASEIYFQQGFDTAEAMKRAQTTIRLAHATGDSMEEVSNWMTAIWNNFDNGTKTLEYYGDVLAKLGAQTASSADEIATGLSKFSAVADTVGLSYEYAASALATLTAETRESPEVVGTALKTIFSRMEGLKLGDILEDGTDLNKYSASLKTIGVDIKDANGELKDMDIILDETASRWQTLTKDQQVALAQGVAGIRQYNQFIALMDNYDIMQNNLRMTKESQGSLREMEEKYKNSIEGIKAEFEAVKETLSMSLMDDDDIKKFYKSITKLVEFVTELVDSFGGLEGVLQKVASILLTTNQPKVNKFFETLSYSLKDTKIHMGNLVDSAKNLKNIKYNIKDFITTGGQNQIKPEKRLTQSQQMRKDIISLSAEVEGSSRTNASEAVTGMTEKITDMKMALEATRDRLTPQQLQIREWQIEILENTKKQIIAEQDKIDQLKQENLILEDNVALAYDAEQINSDIQKNKNKNANTAKKLQQKKESLVKEQSSTTSQLQGINEAKSMVSQLLAESEKEIANYTNQASNKDKSIEKSKWANEVGAVQFAAIEEKLSNLGYELQDFGVSKGENGLLRFANDGISGLQSFIQYLETLNSKLNETGEQAQNLLTANLNEQQAIDIQTGDKRVTDIDRGYMEARNQALGQVQSGAEDALNKIKGVRGVSLTDEGRENTAKTIIKDMEQARDKAEQLGMEIKDVDFDSIFTETESFAEGSLKDLDHLYRQILKVKQAIDEASKTELAKTKDNALLGTQDATSAAFNTLERATLTDSLDKSTSLRETGLTQLGERGEKLQINIKDENGNNTKANAKQALSEKKKNVEDAKKDLKQAKEDIKLGKISAKAYKDKEAALKKARKALKDVNKEIDKEISALKKEYEATQDSIRGTQGFADVNEAAGEAIDEFNAKSVDVEKQADLSGKKVGEFSSKVEVLDEDLSTIKGSDIFGAMATGAVQAAAGFSALEGGVANLMQTMQDGEATAGDYISSLMAIGSGLADLTAPFVKVIGLIITKRLQSKKAAEASDQETTKEVANEGSKFAAHIATAKAKIASMMATPGGQVVAALGIAALAAIGIGMAVNAISSGVKKNEEEQKEKELEKDREVSSAASEVAKTLSGMNKQADTFKELRASGESTTEVLKEMGESLEDLNYQITELYEKAGSSAGAYSGLNNFITQLKTLQDRLGRNPELIDTYKATLQQATTELNLAQMRENYRIFRASGSQEDKMTYLSSLGSTVAGDENLLERAEADFMDNLNDYKTAEEAEKAWGNAIMRAAGIYDDSTESPEAIASLLQHAPVSVFNAIEALRLLDTNGGAVAYQTGINTKGYASARQWMLENPEYASYASDMNLSSITTVEDMNQQFNQLREKERGYALIQEADKLGYDETVFTAYIEQLVDVNDALEENNTLAKEVALDNLKLNNGINILIDSWDDVSTAMRAGKTSSIEYAEAIGTISIGLEEMFGFKPDSKFVQEHFEEIEALINGDVSGLAELQAAMGEEYIYNLEYKYTASGLTPQEQLNTMMELNRLLEQNADLASGEEVNLGEPIAQAIIAKVKQMLIDGFSKEQIEDAVGASGFGISINESDKSISKIYRTVDESGVNASVEKALKERRKKIEEETNAYYKQDKALERLNRDYDRIRDKKSRAYGQSFIDALYEEAGALGAINNATKEKLALAKQEVAEREQTLRNMGAIIGEDGEILNYQALMEHFKNRAATTEQEYEDFKDALEKYEEELELTEDLSDQIQENTNKALDLQLEAIDYQVEIRVEVNEQDLVLIEYQLSHLYDPAMQAAEAIGTIGQKAQIAKKNVDEYAEGIRNVFDTVLDDSQVDRLLNGDMSVLNGIALEQGQIDALKKYSDGLLEQGNNIYAAREEIFEYINTGYEYWNEQYDELTSNAEFFASTMENYKNLVDLVGRKNLGVSVDYMNQLSQQQVKAASAGVKAAKEQLEFNKQTLETFKQQRDEAIASAADEKTKKELEAYWDEVITSAEERVREGEENVQSALSNSLTAAADAFASAINLAAESFEETMSGVYGTFEKLQDAFDKAIATNDRYVDNYTKIYELSKLNRNINKQIDSTDSVKAKSALRELQEEINDLQESETEMSQYDLEYLQKKYDLRLAEIALEEAQNAKSQVRMRRDSEGNWGYVYTADQGVQDTAQQNYEDKLYSTQSHTQSRISELQSQLLDNERQMLDEINNLNPQLENYEQEKQRILDFYAAQEKYLLEQMQIALGNSADIYKNDWQEYVRFTGYKIDNNQQWIDSWEETVLAQKTGFDTIEGYYATFEEATMKLSENVSAAHTTWQENVKESLENAKIDFENFGKEGGEVDTALKNVKSDIDEIGKALNDEKIGLGVRAKDGVQSLIEAFTKNRGLFESETNKYLEYINNLSSKLSIILQQQSQIGDIDSGYYGVVTVGDKKYRSDEKFTTASAAREWAEQQVTSYTNDARAVNIEAQKADAAVPYTEQHLNSVQSSVVQGIDGIGDYEIGGPKVQSWDSTQFSTPGAEPGNQKYYGTLQVGDKTYRTADSYNTEQEAKTAATKLATDKWTELYNTGLALEDKKMKTEADAYKNAEVGAVARDDESEKHTVAKATDVGAQYFKVRTYDGKYKYITYTNTYKPSGFYYTTFSDKKTPAIQVAGSNGSPNYYLGYEDNETLKALASKYPDANNASDAATGMSPSGDFAKYDTTVGSLEVGDKVKIKPEYLEGKRKLYKANYQGKIVSTDHDYKTDWMTGTYTIADSFKAEGATFYGQPFFYTELKFASTGELIPLPQAWFEPDFSAFDTGGYTGEWDSSGRLAMLHQKEIVLNAHDTENFLAAVNIVRDIASMIDLKAAAQTAALSAFTAMYAAPTTQTIEQDVTIHAEFPNATNHSEIEAAFDTLINRAAQFANRKK